MRVVCAAGKIESPCCKVVHVAAGKRRRGRLSSFLFCICLSKEPTTNKCRLDPRRWGSRGLRRTGGFSRVFDVRSHFKRDDAPSYLITPKSRIFGFVLRSLIAWRVRPGRSATVHVTFDPRAKGLFGVLLDLYHFSATLLLVPTFPTTSSCLVSRTRSCQRSFFLATS